MRKLTKNQIKHAVARAVNDLCIDAVPMKDRAQDKLGMFYPRSDCEYASVLTEIRNYTDRQIEVIAGRSLLGQPKGEGEK